MLVGTVQLDVVGAPDAHAHEVRFRRNRRAEPAPFLVVEPDTAVDEQLVRKPAVAFNVRVYHQLHERRGANSRQMVLLRGFGVPRSDGAPKHQAIARIEEHLRPAAGVADGRVRPVLLEDQPDIAHARTHRRQFPGLAAGLEERRRREVPGDRRRILNGAAGSAV